MKQKGEAPAAGAGRGLSLRGLCTVSVLLIPLGSPSETARLARASSGSAFVRAAFVSRSRRGTVFLAAPRRLRKHLRFSLSPAVFRSFRASQWLGDRALETESLPGRFLEPPSPCFWGPAGTGFWPRLVPRPRVCPVPLGARGAVDRAELASSCGSAGSRRVPACALSPGLFANGRRRPVPQGGCPLLPPGWLQGSPRLPEQTPFREQTAGTGGREGPPHPPGALSCGAAGEVSTCLRGGLGTNGVSL